MKLDALERAAAKNVPMPDGLEMPEQYLFLSMRGLYLAYRTGGVAKEQAKREKTAIIEIYECFALQYKIMQQHMRMLRTVQKYSDRIKDSGCDVCKGLYRALCGLPEDNGGCGMKASWTEQTSVTHIGRTNIPISKCSHCGFTLCDILNRTDLYNYCPNCGARMEEGTQQ